VLAESFAEVEAERLNALEKLREPFYGKNQTGGRLQPLLGSTPAAHQ
jgi:hypothetical protein